MREVRHLGPPSTHPHTTHQRRLRQASRVTHVAFSIRQPASKLTPLLTRQRRPRQRRHARTAVRVVAGAAAAMRVAPTPLFVVCFSLSLTNTQRSLSKQLPQVQEGCWSSQSDPEAPQQHSTALTSTSFRRQGGSLHPTPDTCPHNGAPKPSPSKHRDLRQVPQI